MRVVATRVLSQRDCTSTIEFGLPLVEKFILMDITDDKDPSIGNKIAEIHSKRFENDPALVGLIQIFRPTRVAALHRSLALPLVGCSLESSWFMVFLCCRNGPSFWTIAVVISRLSIYQNKMHIKL
jgi:hypothetical protein